MSAPGAADARAARRAFVRAHHPDVGGDPDAFRAGLEAHRAATRPGPAPDDPRLDAPIVAVSGRRIARLGRFGRRLARRYDPRRGSARVQ
ncbi:hypothetical protein ACR9E3_31640 [Actinomycetospora sp. C-140]